jgi:S-adenosylmethionine:tRNA ribosyltransferase-isomerase
MRVDLFDFDLPEDLIALRPARPRDSARLLHVPTQGPFEDRIVSDAAELFRPGDLLVFNDTRVIPARLKGKRVREDSVVEIEATLLKRLSPASWTAFAKPGKRLREGDRVQFGDTTNNACLLGALDAIVTAKGEEGEITLAFDLAGPDLDAAIASAGAMPLPPYIAAKRAEDEADELDYQTVFARVDGAVAAPTAGLHFTGTLLGKLLNSGVESAFVTLHVGAGTFLPVKADDTAEHKMHAEWRAINAATAEAINCAKSEGRRVIAIGTTALRTLESAADKHGVVNAQKGDTDIFITPGYRFRVVDGLWTNFHLPRSTLFMLVSAFAGTERMQAAYAHAMRERYRFYSYGDASLLWRAE